MIVTDEHRTDDSTLVLGDISGIQNYLFGVNDEGGGQAKRLRARSFVIQTLVETVALKVLDALGWSWDQVVFATAGKFLLLGESPKDAETVLKRVRREIEEWLVTHLRGELRYAMAWVGRRGLSDPSFAEWFDAVQNWLQRQKLQPWATVAQEEGHWNPVRLMLPPLDTPCALCGRFPATETDVEDGVPRQICRRCKEDEAIGKKLPISKYLVITRDTAKADIELMGYGISLIRTDRLPVPPDAVAAAAGLDESAHPLTEITSDRIIPRQLARHIPTNKEGMPVLFTALAERSQGDTLLAVLKADVDDLGLFVNTTLRSQDPSKLKGFSVELDAFFSGWITQQMRDPPWESIYTVFAGGDDLLLIGPWNVVFDFLGHMQHHFAKSLGTKYQLTFSAGLALTRAKQPIKFAAERAEKLLEQAKTEPAQGAIAAKDQCAAFGGRWKWAEHESIVAAAKQLALWVNEGVCLRGWVQHLLRLAEERHKGDLRTTARLAYFIARNVPISGFSSGNRKVLRYWLEQILDDFDEQKTLPARYLEVICRYALTATRSMSRN